MSTISVELLKHYYFGFRVSNRRSLTLKFVKKDGAENVFIERLNSDPNDDSIATAERRRHDG